MFRKVVLNLLLVMGLLTPVNAASAAGALTRQVFQEQEGPVYIVQEGDSLWGIALRFKVSLDELAKANNISDPSQLVIGARLVIPGLSGVSGVLATRTVSYGETLHSLSRGYQMPVSVLAKLNHLTSPNELFAGATLIIPQEMTSAQTLQRSLLLPGQSLLEAAILHGVSPWTYILANDLPGDWAALPGAVLYFTAPAGAENASGNPSALPEMISIAHVAPSPMIQGQAADIEITGTVGMSLTGSLAGYRLDFFPVSPTSYASLQGLHALTEPGIYSLALTGTLPSAAPYFGATFTFAQPVRINSGNYPFDPVLIVNPETIDPAVTDPENIQWAALTAAVTPEKLWQGVFTAPVPAPFSDCWPSRYGNRRSYNGSAYTYFHTGLDFCGEVGTDILAPAAGRVVFAGALTVRGNATVIDHGWGVYSAYLHQSEILVKVGGLVQSGQLIGKIGSTGRVTGPHLHWEIWAGGVQVDPMPWLQQAYPY